MSGGDYGAPEDHLELAEYHQEKADSEYVAFNEGGRGEYALRASEFHGRTAQWHATMAVALLLVERRET